MRRFFYRAFRKCVWFLRFIRPLFRHQIAVGRPTTLTYPEINRYFMAIPLVAQLVPQAAFLAQGG
jgi:FlaA1/EpsC-like NDP-sugar epimerase